MPRGLFGWQRNYILGFILGISLSLCPLWLGVCMGGEVGDKWPKRVLITNDDGIDSSKIIALARAFAPTTETWVVAPLENKSRSGHYTTIDKLKELAVEPRDLGEGIHAFGVNGYPADCVILALAGMMRDRPPDLVISGINGGANLGPSWIGSGTIGAARMASFAGFPAIAISGPSYEIPGNVEAAARWVVDFVRTDLVLQLQPPQYLTVSYPRLPPDRIKGMRVTHRAGLTKRPILKRSHQQAEGNREIWHIVGYETLQPASPNENDTKLYQKGYIVVVPMQADEHDYDTLSR